MDDSDLHRLLSDIESDRVERKASASDGTAIREAVCSFANDLPNHCSPGVVFVDVKDDGSCAGLHISDQLLLTLSDIKTDGNIVPLPSLTVQKRNLGGCELAVVVVQPSDTPPVRFRGRTCVRVGPRRGYATPEEERRLSERRRSHDLPFDIQTARAATLEDLDLGLFRQQYLPSAVAGDVLEENARTTEEQLVSLRFAADSGAMPTTVGLLVIGKDPRRFFPGAYVQFLRVDGTVLTDPIKDQKEIDGPLPEMLRLLNETLRTHISTALDIVSGSVDIKRPDYPIAALDQLTRNAVLHRTYEGTSAPVRISWFQDRIEILSPGGPYGEVNRENFGQSGLTDYRNPHLAEAMKNLGYVQRFGIGLEIARNEAEKNGNPPPEFVVEESHVLAVLRREQ